MANRFLGIGINKYPDAPLYGCYNDIEDACDKLQSMGWSYRNMDVVTDRRATKRRIMQRLRSFVEQSAIGDKLIIHYSGHGVQIPTKYSDGVDGRVEGLCPVDFEDESTAITDKEMIYELRKLPACVDCTVILDSCFAGGMPIVRSVVSGIETQQIARSYPLRTRLDLKIRHESAIELGISVTNPFVRSVSEALPDVCWMLGCQENQTCADAYFHTIGFRGAFSKFLWEALFNNSEVSRYDNMMVCTHNLSENLFVQVPLTIGPDRLKNLPLG
jgi:hypothetical protein